MSAVLSLRPEIVAGVADPGGDRVGPPTPGNLPYPILGRERVVSALPLNRDGPRQLGGPELGVSMIPSYVGDTGGAKLGVSGAVWVHRLLDARWTQDTRRLGG